MRNLSKLILKSLGWKVLGMTEYSEKCVICVAPHTSNWDFFLGKLVYSSLGKKASFLMKKTWFFFPLNIILKSLGGIPVDRSKKNSLTDQLAEVFKSRDYFQLAITPEGTRKRNQDWKKGFYYIALTANVPIMIVILNYETKTVNFEAVFNPTGDIDKDMEEIKSYYKDAVGKHPENFTTGNSK